VKKCVCVLADETRPGNCATEDPCGTPSLEDCKDGSYFPNTCDCSHFHQCHPDGYVDNLICTDGLVFNPDTFSCIPKDNAPPGLCDDGKNYAKPSA